VLDALRLADEHEAVRRRIPGLDYQVVIRSHADDMATDPLTLKESIVIASIERGAQTVREVAEATRLAEVELLRLIDALCRRNLLELVPPGKSPHDRRSNPRAFRVLGRAAKATAAALRTLAN
jgi:DNA-binding MarR family transcriptional regulator